ncbi:glycosyltransferase [uncultured Cohaesibacter sp.]|uniref:glycosyltransferase n=1 Tax=uncultured Cohaesibacter sp. TaxID=1002546 RepID=UPI0029C99590|nr:glycosyltransferase [uncultured Cohaesibacter sp.]
MKIVAAVPNSAVKDGRVIKQAKSLESRGHEVSVVGIQDADNPSYRSVVGQSILIFREDIKAKTTKWRQTIEFCVSAIAILAAIASILAGYRLLQDPSRTGQPAVPIDWSGTASHLASYWQEFVYIIAILVILALFRKPIEQTLRQLSSNIWSPFDQIQANFNMVLKVRAIRKTQAKRIIELKPDLIYCHEALSLPACADAKQALGVSLVYDAHEFYDDVTGANAELVCRFYKSIHRKLLDKVDFFVTVTPTIRDTYFEKYPDMTRASTVLWNSVPKPPVSEYDGRLHAKTNLPDDQKILLYQGGISLKRKVDQVVLAARNLPADWSVVLMGSGGQDLVTIKKIAKALNEEFEEPQILKQLSPDQLEDFKASIVRYLERNLGHENAAVEARDEREELQWQKETGSVETSPSNMYRNSAEQFDVALRKRTQKRNKFKSQGMQLKIAEEFSEAVDDIMHDADQIISFQAKIRIKDWKLAKKLALTELLQKNPEFFQIVPRVVFVPAVPQSELLDWTKGATVGVIPYPITSLNHWGCGPNKLWEYPAARVPILATPSVEIRKIIAEYGIGWTIEADPTYGNIATVISHLTDADIAQAKQSCTTFIEESNWDIHTQSWLDGIEGLGPK